MQESYNCPHCQGRHRPESNWCDTTGSPLPAGRVVTEDLDLAGLFVQLERDPLGRHESLRGFHEKRDVLKDRLAALFTVLGAGRHEKEVSTRELHRAVADRLQHGRGVGRLRAVRRALAVQLLPGGVVLPNPEAAGASEIDDHLVLAVVV